jgi:prevent-host-death family protein
MEVSTTQFQHDCLQFIETVHGQQTEIIITKHGKPWAKLMAIEETPTQQPFLGALSGVGTTVGNLLDPFEDEWECD